MIYGAIFRRKGFRSSSRCRRDLRKTFLIVAMPSERISRVAVSSSRSVTCIYTTYGTKAFHGYSKLAEIFRKLPAVESARADSQIPTPTFTGDCESTRDPMLPFPNNGENCP